MRPVVDLTSAFARIQRFNVGTQDIANVCPRGMFAVVRRLEVRSSSNIFSSSSFYLEIDILLIKGRMSQLICTFYHRVLQAGLLLHRDGLLSRRVCFANLFIQNFGETNLKQATMWCRSTQLSQRQ